MQILIGSLLRSAVFELTTCGSLVKFKVSPTNIFHEAKKSQIVIISRAQIDTEIPQTALNFMEKMNK